MSIPISRYCDLLRAFEEYEKRNPQTKIESEDKPMLHNITVTKTEEKVLEEYWIIKGIRNLIPPTNDLHVTEEYKKEPTLEDIAQFLSDTNAKSVTVEHNYRFKPDLPFC